MGVTLDGQAAAQFKTLTNSEIAFAADGEIQAATLPETNWPLLAALLKNPGITPKATIDGNEYIVLTLPLAPSGTPGSATAPDSSLADRAAPLSAHPSHELGVDGGARGSGGNAPELRDCTDRDPAARHDHGDDARDGGHRRPHAAISVPADERWQDEDARLLATTFNTMTDSIAAVSARSHQRERLSSLGRLSTVVAHEIRNPLMIIKAALRTLRQEAQAPDQVKRAARDIDEEITRLNRIVSEVLDFARPIQFDLASTDINALATDAVRAAATDGARPTVHLKLDPNIPVMTTDAERLRQVLVNVLGNALQAIAGQTATDAGRSALIRMETRRLDSQRVAITVRDHGTGIKPDDLPRIFDPYFTTRRTGTGIGLAISRNIVEGLGGRITVASQPERGTEVRIELPLHSTAA